MRKFYIFLTFIVISSFINQTLLAKLENNIVLKVENEIITKYDIKNKILSSLILSGKEINQENIDKYKKSTLDNLIQLKLMKIELSKYNIKKDDSKINSYLNLVSSNNIEGLKIIFKENNLDYDFFLEEIETQFKWQKLIHQIYVNKIKIDEKMINKNLNNFIKNKADIEEFKISEIEIYLDKNSEYDNEISKILNEIKEIGFENTALKYSVSNSAEDKGNLGWMNAKSLSKEIYDTINKMNIGEITNPIKRGDSILILKLNDKKISKSDDIDKKKLKKNIVNLKRNELFDLYSKSHISKLQNNSYIEYK